MKLVSYDDNGSVRHGRLDGEVITELGSGDLFELVAGKEPVTESGPTRPLSEVSLLAPLRRPGKLLAVAANYQAHVREAGADDLDKSRISPRLFLKPSTSIVGPDAEVELPAETPAMDWEAELVVVIGAAPDGKPCRHVSEERALDHVFGYLAGNDVSARKLDFGYERDFDDKMVGFFDWLEGKWFDGFAPMGPWIATADEITDPQRLDVGLTLNGEVRQEGNTGAMIFSVAEVIAFASKLMTLEPGDVIMTGTPAGVGAATGTFLAAGDEMTVTVEGLGSLTTRVV